MLRAGGRDRQEFHESYVRVEALLSPRSREGKSVDHFRKRGNTDQVLGEALQENRSRCSGRQAQFHVLNTCLLWRGANFSGNTPVYQC